METEGIIYKQRKRKVLVVLGIMQVVADITVLLLGRYEAASNLAAILAAVGLAVGILYWVGIDSEERGAKVSSGLRIAIVLVGFFALAYYLLKTRGFLGGLKGIGLALLYFVALIAIYFVVSVVILIILHLAGVKV